MEEMIIYFGCFVIVYLLYFLLVILQKKALIKYETSTEIRFLETKYKIKFKRKDMKKIASLNALGNAFIISNVILVIGFVEGIIFQMLLGFVILIPSILIVYSILGKHYQKKYGGK